MTDEVNESNMPTLLTDASIIGGLTRAEIDVQIATSHRFPRSLTKVHRALETLVTIDVETATLCRYQKPQGKSFIEGPSIRFAEAVLATWGNARVASRRTDLTEDSVEATGIFHDLETNVAWAKSHRVSILTKEGKRYPTHMIETASNAAASIALRNAILAGIPRAIWGRGYAKALAAIRGDASTLGTRRVEMLRMYQDAGVTAEQVYQLLGVRGRDDIDLDLLYTAAGLLTALRDGETTLAELLAQRAGGPEGGAAPSLGEAFGKPSAARSAAAPKPTSASATAASGPSPAATSSPPAPAAPSPAGEPAREEPTKAEPEAPEDDGWPGGGAPVSLGAPTAEPLRYDAESLTRVQEAAERALAAAKPPGADNIVPLRPAAAESDAAADKTTEAKAEAFDEAAFIEAFQVFDSATENADSWLAIKPLLAKFAAEANFRAARPQFQDQVFGMAYDRAVEIRDPVKPSEDPMFFRCWLRGDRSKTVLDTAQAMFTRLVRHPSYRKTDTEERRAIAYEIERLP